MTTIRVDIAPNLWCVGASWYRNKYRSRLIIFPLPFVVITIEKMKLDPEFDEFVDELLKSVRERK
ncbi:hypothetical protein EOM86_01625 [Candidatus Nomurabacteria bacterium]|nr:hypothetical protein [Candidatus Nomurabacteria bacterium]